MTPEQLREFEELKATVEALKASATIPLDVDNALRDRLGIDDLATLAGSSKNPSTETQSVDEGGIDGYSVAKPMDGFYEDENGKHIPYYNA